MEIHPPDGPPRSLRDFALHLLTITAGILIALSLEGLVEYVHHQHLVHEARRNLQAEIAANRSELEETLGGLPALGRQVQDAVTRIGALAPGGTLEGELHLGMHAALLGDTSWETAQRSGAVSFMPYEEIEHYAALYGVQARFLEIQEKLVDRILDTDLKASDIQERAQALGKLRDVEHSRHGLEQYGAILRKLYADDAGSVPHR